MTTWHPTDDVTLRQGLKPHGFFRHSSVRDVLRSGAWLQLGAHRNGGGIAETAHPFMLPVSCGRVGSGCPLTRVTRHPLAEPDLRVSRYPALPLRFAEDILYQ